jgi:flagellar protein FliO/FliZ
MGDLTSTLAIVAIMVVLLAMVPAAVKWIQARAGSGQAGAQMATRLVSAVAVGPHQRVVTVEVGPPDARTMLVLGVTAQAVSCLHSIALRPEAPPDRMEPTYAAVAQQVVQS